MSEFTPAATVAPDAPSDHLFRKLLRNPLAVVSMAYLLILTLVAILGSFIAPHDPNLSSIKEILNQPSAEHLLGTDSAGRDVISRLLVATQVSIAAALVALVVSLIIGVVGGLLAGYYGGFFDNISSWGTAIIMALPAVIVLLAARAVFGPSVWMSMAVFGVLLSPAFFRLVYTLVRGVRGELYVDAARVSGLSDSRIIGRHILTVVRAPIIIQSAIVLGIAIAIQSGLEFLGLGDLMVPTWGAMLNDGFGNIYRQPTLVIWPALAVAFTCMALVLLANSIRDILEGSAPTQRRTVKVVPEVETAESAPASDILLSVRNVRVGYNQPGGSIKEVVHGVSLDLRKGEVHGLIGESGSGKTQTAFSVMGLLPQGGNVLGGSILFDGIQLVGASEDVFRKVRGRRIAYIPQEPMSNLDPSFTIGSQLIEPMRDVLGISKKDAQERVIALLRRVGIPDPARTMASYPHEISGGMAQRVLIAGAVSCDAELIIADEPTTALDVTVQAEVLDLLRDLQQERQLSILLVTHNFGVVADLCDRVSVMQMGKIVESGDVVDIFTKPTNAYTKSLLDAILDESTPRGALATTGGAA
ncbi:peptide/nickel transport system permease protein [Aurantimicrobium minutum]|uniref:dipeptide/oligopeptide/nickel ABC transporter permease/ATP-binding protein n=1 Tax=Aurantimicrobium minutum TaxID=708131 RepID=UPI0024754B6F|nr:dipeptide/oligopeptide/nickel ABC transporter permease/ATP-binding protein [Aurantimicrobium minutum]MDH6532556.1 peptide/nickel transport system permease protein [Aurantimicrobium minutum]